MDLEELSAALREQILALALDNQGPWDAWMGREMTREDEHPTSHEAEIARFKADLVPDLRFPGVPKRPFYRALASNLARWGASGEFPFKHRPFPLLREKEGYFQRLEAMGLEVMQLSQSWEQLGPADRQHLVKAFLKGLSLRDVLTLLGMRHTEGSLQSFPPSLEECIVAFNTLHRPGTSLLTVGAKAFTKHSHRDETSQWWGKSTGSEENKNRLANSVVIKILNQVVWMNIHQLPHNIRIFEIRHEDGYGARWGMWDVEEEGGSQEGAKTLVTKIDFRGFLEPQMEGGHEVGWRH